VKAVHAGTIRAVLLDLDDTLTDRLATVRAYARHFVNDFGERFQLSDVTVVAGEIARIDENGYNPDRASDLAAHVAWSSSPGADLLAEHWDHYFAVCTQPREGVSATIAAFAQAAIRLGVVTNGRTDRQRRKIEALHLEDQLGVVLISEEFGAAKPDASIFLAAAAKLGVHPRECIFIGDNPEKDVRGSSAVGMRAVWFRSTMPWPEDLAPPREIVTSFREVLELPGLHL
jgi:putative hydrolase of the HAD superfamily